MSLNGHLENLGGINLMCITFLWLLSLVVVVVVVALVAAVVVAVDNDLIWDSVSTAAESNSDVHCGNIHWGINLKNDIFIFIFIFIAQ